MRADGTTQRAQILKYLETGNYDKRQIAAALGYELSHVQSRLKELSVRREIFSKRVEIGPENKYGSRTVYTLEKPAGFVGYRGPVVDTYVPPFEDTNLNRLMGYSSLGRDKPTRTLDADQFERDYALAPSQRAYASSYYANQATFPPVVPL